MSRAYQPEARVIARFDQFFNTKEALLDAIRDPYALKEKPGQTAPREKTNPYEVAAFVFLANQKTPTLFESVLKEIKVKTPEELVEDPEFREALPEDFKKKSSEELLKDLEFSKALVNDFGSEASKALVKDFEPLAKDLEASKALVNAFESEAPKDLKALLKVASYKYEVGIEASVAILERMKELGGGVLSKDAKDLMLDIVAFKSSPIPDNVFNDVFLGKLATFNDKAFQDDLKEKRYIEAPMPSATPASTYREPPLPAFAKHLGLGREG